jgi:phage tail sheath protein FI
MAGAYYPSGFATNLDGSSVVVPPSHIALRTIAFNDQVAFPWFAPAGLTRGLVDNATSVGFIDSKEGEFQPVQLTEGQRDTLYANKINPIAFIPNRGLVVFGQKTLASVASAMDRVNVARLLAFLRYELDNLAKPFLFEPNDIMTRGQVEDTFNRFLEELITKRALFDFLVVCDDTNNTPARIDRNELYIDIAIQPVKAIEFIYIPVRIKNTGESLSN